MNGRPNYNSTFSEEDLKLLKKSARPLSIRNPNIESKISLGYKSY
jgi:hypothetical protein